MNDWCQEPKWVEWITQEIPVVYTLDKGNEDKYNTTVVVEGSNIVP